MTTRPLAPRLSYSILTLLSAALFACGGGPRPPDVGTDALVGVTDAGPVDAGYRTDGGGVDGGAPDPCVEYAATPSNGHAYYVAPGGDDSGNGSRAQPWRTLTHAATVASAGDVVHVLAGDYSDEEVVLPRGGTSGSTLTFLAEPAGAAKVRSFALTELSYVTLCGFEVVGTFQFPPGWVEISSKPGGAVVFDAGHTVVRASPCEKWTQETCDYLPGQSGCTCKPTQLETIWSKYPLYMSLEANPETVICHQCLANDGGCHDRKTTLPTGSFNDQGRNDVGIGLYGSDHIIVDSNTVSLHSAGIVAEADSSRIASNITLIRNTVFDCSDGILSMQDIRTPAGNPAPYPRVGLQDSLIEGNHAFDNLKVGISLWHFMDRVTIRGNRTEYNGIGGIGLQVGASNSQVLSNTSLYSGLYTEVMRCPGSSGINVWGPGIGNSVIGNFIAHQYDWTHVDGNGIIIDTQGFMTDAGLDAGPVLIQNNVLYRNEGGGIAEAASPGQIIENNTVVENGWGNDLPFPDDHGGPGFGLRLGQVGDAGSDVLANNVLFGNSKAGVYSSSGSWSVLDYNLYSQNGDGGSTDIVTGRGRRYTRSQACTDLGAECHGRDALDPLFVDPANANFRLEADSPARDYGDNAYAPLKDFDGVTRVTPDDPTVDIGAFEYRPATDGGIPGQ